MHKRSRARIPSIVSVSRTKGPSCTSPTIEDRSIPHPVISTARLPSHPSPQSFHDSASGPLSHVLPFPFPPPPLSLPYTHSPSSCSSPLFPIRTALLTALLSFPPPMHAPPHSWTLSRTSVATRSTLDEHDPTTINIHVFKNRIIHTWPFAFHPIPSSECPGFHRKGQNVNIYRQTDLSTSHLC